jgi:lipoate-protein ligase A
VSDWLIERNRDTARRLHEASADLVAGSGDGVPGVTRRIRVLDVSAPALVLGRAQAEEHVDAGRAAAAGVEVVRRRSGGGAVLMVPHGAVWIDIVVPAGDPLWASDIGRAMWWVGEVWVAALDAVGGPHGEVWRGPLQRTAWSDRVCFGGLGAGEVTIGEKKVGGKGAPGPKIVGVAQRRTRRGALFQCTALVDWHPEDTLDLLALPESRRRSGASELAGVAVGVGERAEALAEAVIRQVVEAGPARAGVRLP